MSVLDKMDGVMIGTPTDYVSAREYYEKNLQEKINETWEFASTNYKIGEEQTPGTLVFSEIVCRVVHAIEPTVGTNLGDDFRMLKFKELYIPRVMGQRYRFDESDWITINTDNYKTPTKSAVIRRCNNTLNHITPEGTIVQEPCIMDYAMKYVNIYFNDTVDIPQGSAVIRLQNNDWTKTIDINDRFVINDHVYKVKAVKNYLRDKTYVKDSAPIITLEVYLDNIGPDDDLELGIANMDRYKDIYPPNKPVVNEIVFSPNLDTLYQYDEQPFTCYEFKNGVATDSTFTFEFKGVPNEYYEAKVISGNEFVITNKRAYYGTPLLVVATSNNGDVSSMEINLKGLF